jgi:hypothetical protein
VVYASDVLIGRPREVFKNSEAVCCGKDKIINLNNFTTCYFVANKTILSMYKYECLSRKANPLLDEVESLAPVGKTRNIIYKEAL